jgi:hypothetical protein
MPKAKKRAPPPAGAEFEKTYKGKKYRLRVLRDDDVTFYCVGKDKFTSPSSAGRGVTGHHVNGWRFWGIEN